MKDDNINGKEGKVLTVMWRKKGFDETGEDSGERERGP